MSNYFRDTRVQLFGIHRFRQIVSDPELPAPLNAFGIVQCRDNDYRSNLGDVV